MRVLPVLDVMGGEIVHAVGGRRHEYRRASSCLTASSRPLEVAEALRDCFGFHELYLADLDAIAGAEPDWPILSGLRSSGFRLWADAGVRTMTRACQLAESGIESIVVGLETVEGPEALAAIVSAFASRVVFSLDLRDGEPLGQRAAWGTEDPEMIAARAIDLGVRRLLVLDLARVGREGGIGTRDLCTHLHAAFPEVEISTGGGVRDRADLEVLRARGVRFALTASALHDGRLTRADLEGL